MNSSSVVPPFVLNSLSQIQSCSRYEIHSSGFWIFLSWVQLAVMEVTLQLEQWWGSMLCILIHQAISCHIANFLRNYRLHFKIIQMQPLQQRNQYCSTWLSPHKLVHLTHLSQWSFYPSLFYLQELLCPHKNLIFFQSRPTSYLIFFTALPLAPQQKYLRQATTVTGFARELCDVDTFLHSWQCYSNFQKCPIFLQ